MKRAQWSENLAVAKSARHALVEEWQLLHHVITDRAIKQWRPRLRSSVRERGRHFEHQLYPNFSSTVRDLGVTLDQELTLATHIHSLCRACYYQLRQLRTVTRSLT